MKSTKLLLIFALSYFSSFAQPYSFNCGTTGYVAFSGGGTFMNVDNSGVNMVITGMYGDYCNGISLITGINDGGNFGVVHTYEFVFSEPVDVSFFISNITIDPVAPCHNDLLTFFGAPIFSDSNNIMVAGNAIVPMIADSMPTYIKVAYENISSFSFTHGEGNGACNPGYITIGNMEFTPKHGTTSLNELGMNDQLIVNTLVQNQLILNDEVKEVSELTIVDMSGRKCSVALNPGEETPIDVTHLSNGHYFLLFMRDEQPVSERFVIHR